MERAMESPCYPDNVSDKEWNVIKTHLEVRSPLGGRPPKYAKRVMFDALLYLLRSGCSWRHLPNDFPPWKSVYTQYRTWMKNCIFEKIQRVLYKKLRKLQRKSPIPSIGIVEPID